MMSTRQAILDEILSRLLFDDVTGDSSISEQSVLLELGVTSLHIITLLLELQPTHGTGLSQLADAGMPVTVGDLVTLVENKGEVSQA